MRLIIDSHLDIGWNAVSFNRDQTLTVEQIRKREADMTDEPSRGNNTVTLPALRRGGIALSVATLLARGGPEQKTQKSYLRSDLDFANQDIAHAAALGQLGYYRLLEQQGHMRFIHTAAELDAHWEQWTGQGEQTKDAPLGFILSMEGADPIVEPQQVSWWWDQGLRALEPVHYGKSHYAVGTGMDGPLTEKGVALLDEMQKVGMILDVTHLSDTSMAQALDQFEGPVLASHHNCRALVPGDRQLTDDQIKQLIARGAVIGAAFDAWMLYPNWIRRETKRDVVSIEAVADHIDHVCQLAGNAKHSGIGSDLDGGFGTEQTPRGLDTIADLQKMEDILAARSYSDADIDAIFHGNWLNFFRSALPAD